MPFYNGSTAVINGASGTGPASNTADFLTRLRNFMVASGYTVTNVVGIGGGQANLILSSSGTNSDENINIRLCQGNVQNALNPFNTPVASNRVRVTVAPFFDSAAQLTYNEAGQSPAACEIPTDDQNPFNFWAFVDGPPATYVWVVTQLAGAYNTLFAGRLARATYTELAKLSQGITVTTPGVAQSVTATLDRPRPASWVQGKVLCVHSQNLADKSGNGAGIGAQMLPVEFGTLQSQAGLGTNQINIQVSRNYAAGALLGQDALPLGVIQSPLGAGETLALSYDNGGGLNQLGYAGPASQPCQVGVPGLSAAGSDVAAVLQNQGPDAYQGDQLIDGLVTFCATQSRRFAFRHILPAYGRVSLAVNPMDEIVLPAGDHWLAFTVGGARIALGKAS